MSGLALEVIRQHGLDTRFMHFDTMTLSFYGAYESEGLSAMSDGIAPPPKVTYGHSKVKRPDLKQVVFGSLVTADGGVPLMGKVLDGNLLIRWRRRSSSAGFVNWWRIRARCAWSPTARAGAIGR